MVRICDEDGEQQSAEAVLDLMRRKEYDRGAITRISLPHIGHRSQVFMR